jgi:hypothetical protein
MGRAFSKARDQSFTQSLTTAVILISLIKILKSIRIPRILKTTLEPTKWVQLIYIKLNQNNIPQSKISWSYHHSKSLNSIRIRYFSHSKLSLYPATKPSNLKCLTINLIRSREFKIKSKWRHQKIRIWCWRRISKGILRTQLIRESETRQ